MTSHPSAAPLIAMTTSAKYGLAWGEYDVPHRLDYMVTEYTTCLEAAGGLPVGLPVTADPATTAATLERADGLLLTGGVDINPAMFGQTPVKGLGQIDAPLDVMELAAARAALEMGKPILGICRGIQILAVACSGSLYQDLPSQKPGAINHGPNVAKNVVTHPVKIVKPSLLHDILGLDEIMINSKHHQAVDQPPPGFEVSAQAADGVIEALEKPGYPWLLGLQWHPEGTCKEDRSSALIFEAFISACGG